MAVRSASIQVAPRPPAQKPPPRRRFAKLGSILSRVSPSSIWSRSGRRRPSGQTIIAIFTAVTLVVVGTAAGIKLKDYKAPPSIQTIRIGKSGTDALKGASDPLTTSTGAPVATKAKAAVVPAVAPLQNRVDPDLFLTSTGTLTAAQIASVTRATGAIRVLPVDYAQVKLGKGITAAVGVDPSTFRQYTPDNTAPVNALWQQVASGDAAVAHAVALALQIKLGAHTVVGRTVQRDVRVGAFATTRLPGIGIVVDRSKSATLGLVHTAALIMVLPQGADPLAALSSALQALPFTKVQALRYSTGAIGTTPGGPVVPGGVPILGRGWTLPLRLGTFTLTQRYGYPNGHPGIDLAAPWGTPIYAAAEGDVLYWGPAQGFGNWIVLQHPGGIQTVYGHMRADELLIGPTAHVQAGQLIARVGSEGNSTGPHLHFEVHINNVRTDPIAFLNAMGVNEIR